MLTEASSKEREQDTAHSHNSGLCRLQRCEEVEVALVVNHDIGQCNVWLRLRNKVEGGGR